MTRTVLYARVSTTDQTIEHQKAQAEAAGFTLDDVIEDHGVSGVQTSLAERDNGKRLFDLLRDGDTLVVRWVDRLGRNYDDIQKNIRLFLDRGVSIRTVINTMTFDAKPQDAMSKAVRDAMLSFMSAMAEAQAIAMKEAQAAGIAHAKANEPTKYRGRKPSYTCDEWYRVVSLREQGFGVNETARRTGLNKFLVSRISNNQEKTFKALELWDLLPRPDTGHDMQHKFKDMAKKAQSAAGKDKHFADKKITETGFVAKYPQVTESSEGYLYH